MQEKALRWLNIAGQIYEKIRPKAYNIIAKAVVLTGVGLIIESQTNIVHAFAVALFEEYIGKSEILRQVLEATDSATLGVFLVLSGMTYHRYSRQRVHRYKKGRVTRLTFSTLPTIER